jgi:ribosomal protein S18 acetylase RimI-like enzyme
MAIELRDRIEEGQMADLMALYRQTYWGQERTEEEVRKMLAHTDLIFSLVDADSGRLVGFARVLTDTVYKAFVFDVIVDEGHRGQGLVRRLLDAITTHPQLSEVQYFELYCRPDVVELYRRWGFGTELNGQVFMRREGRKKV